MLEVLEADLVNHRRRGEQAREANAWMNKGYIQMHRASDEAVTSLRHAVTLSQRAGNRMVEATARYNLCCLLFTLGRLTEAQAEGLAAQSLAGALDHHRQLAMCKLGLAHIAAARRDPAVTALLDDAVELSTAAGDPATTNLAQMLLAPMWHEQGEVARAEAMWTEAVAAFERGPRSERFVVALQVHEALYDLCRGDPAPVDTLIAAHPDSNPARMLRLWADARR